MDKVETTVKVGQCLVLIEGPGAEVVEVMARFFCDAPKARMRNRRKDGPRASTIEVKEAISDILREGDYPLTESEIITEMDRRGVSHSETINHLLLGLFREGIVARKFNTPARGEGRGTRYRYYHRSDEEGKS